MLESPLQVEESSIYIAVLGEIKPTASGHDSYVALGAAGGDPTYNSPVYEPPQARADRGSTTVVNNKNAAHNHLAINPAFPEYELPVPEYMTPVTGTCAPATYETPVADYMTPVTGTGGTPAAYAYEMPVSQGYDAIVFQSSDHPQALVPAGPRRTADEIDIPIRNNVIAPSAPVPVGSYPSNSTPWDGTRYDVGNRASANSGLWNTSTYDTSLSPHSSTTSAAAAAVAAANGAAARRPSQPWNSAVYHTENDLTNGDDDNNSRLNSEYQQIDPQPIAPASATYASAERPASATQQSPLRNENGILYSLPPAVRPARSELEYEQLVPFDEEAEMIPAPKFESSEMIAIDNLRQKSENNKNNNNNNNSNNHNNNNNNNNSAYGLLPGFASGAATNNNNKNNNYYTNNSKERGSFRNIHRPSLADDDV